ncbi:MAG: CehA/McbA family metallohydrolase [Bradymonadaceae bacterium]|nr:CehA/McbA family metallohydrolase [Lujinxingiaceae bacterium]
MNRRLLLAALLISLLAPACSDDPEPTIKPTLDVGHDTPLVDDLAPDLVDEPDIDTGTPDDVSDVGLPPVPGSPVALDLGPFLEGAPDPGSSVRLYQVTDAADLLSGTGAEGLVGDYIIENEHARFVIQADRRAMSACPWGGNVIDAQYLGAANAGDILEEICLFLNADQTFKPERFEVVHDGSQGHAVLAVTGRTEILDFLNLSTMIAAIDPALVAQFNIRPNALMPLTMTLYYVLRPGDTGVRVLSAMRNDGEERLDIAASHIVVSGGTGGYFNPLNSLKGFGYEDKGLANPDPDLLPYLVFRGEESSFAYVPKPFDHLQADLPIAGAYLTLHGVAASLLGRIDIVQTLLSPKNRFASMPGLYHLEPGQSDAIEHWVFAGSGALSTMLDTIYGVQGVATGELEGIVRDGQGQAVEGARVSAVDAKGRTMNQAISGADGRYSMRVPANTYTVSARLVGRPTSTPPQATVVADQTTSVADLTIVQAATISVSVRTPTGDPTPARVSVICEGPCPSKPTAREEEVTFHRLPEGFAMIEWVGVSGDHSFDLPAGTYRIVVSRGLEWSVWPPQALSEGGQLITVAAGATANVVAEIARVLDTNGALSGDFHVHAIASPDSAVAETNRILTFLTEGVDVVVSTDHDVIADFGPAVIELGASAEIVTIVGNEITTSDMGHFNGFPVVRDAGALRGGALDWGNGAEASVTPSQIFDWVRAHPGEQVVQINHPDSSFMRQGDVLRGLTYGDPVRMRVAAEADPDTGETGLWSDDFTAMELLNGHGLERFWAVGRWWLTLIGRGMTPTGTAVTDTHRHYGDVMGGVPRTFVFLPEGKDTIASFETAAFVEAINQNRAIGTNGPFFRVVAINDANERAHIGDTIATNSAPVQFEIEIQVPEWMKVDRLDLYMNAEDVVTAPGVYKTDPLAPTESWSFELGPDDLVEVATGSLTHRRYHKTLTVTLESAVDAYAVFLVRGTQAPTMYPILPVRAARPFAFSNPVYLDADGGGYNNPHLLAQSQTPPPQRQAPQREVASPIEHRELTRQEVGRIMHGLQCGGH